MYTLHIVFLPQEVEILQEKAQQVVYKKSFNEYLNAQQQN